MTAIWGAVDGLWADVGRWWGGLAVDADAQYLPYHVRLGSIGLILTRDGYERRLVQQFAAKLGAGSTSSGDRLGEQAVPIDDWSGGEGAVFQTDDARYRSGTSIDVYSDPGSVALGPHVATAQATALDELTVATQYGANLFVGTGSGNVYKWDGTTWSLSDSAALANGVRWMLTYQNKLIVGSGTIGTCRYYDGSSWGASYAGNAAHTAVQAACVHTVNTVERLYFFCERSNGAQFRYTTDPTLTTASDPSYSITEPSVHVAVVLDNVLTFVGVDITGRQSSIWTIADDETTGGRIRRVVSQPGAVLTVGAVFNGELYLGDRIDGRIWKYDGSKLTLVRQLATNLAPYTAEIRGMTVFRGALWVQIADASGGTLGLLRYDGTSWSRPVSGLTGTNGRGLAVYGGELYYCTMAAGASALYKTASTYRSTGRVESGLIDGNLPGTQKVWRSVTVAHSLLVSGQSVQVEYQTEDANGWVVLGTSSTVGTTGADLSFSTTVQAAIIAFRVTLNGAAGSSTPLKVYAMSAQFYPTPDSLREWSLNVRLEGTTTRNLKLLDGTTEQETGETLSQSIWALVDANTPVHFVDLDRREYDVRIAEYSEGFAPLPLIDAQNKGYEFVGQLKLAEV